MKKGTHKAIALRMSKKTGWTDADYVHGAGQSRPTWSLGQSEADTKSRPK